MVNFSDIVNVDHLIGLWDFRARAENRDTGLADGVVQDGVFERGARAEGERLRTDGRADYFDVSGADDPFDLQRGTLGLQFNQEVHRGHAPDTLVNRGEANDAAREGFFEIRVTASGRIEALHVVPGQAAVMLRSDAAFFAPGDDVGVRYSWNARTGATLTVENLTRGAEQVVETARRGLTFEIGDNDDENFTFAARERDDGRYDRFFDGEIDFVALYDRDVLPGDALDFVVEGTDGVDLIDMGYDGDPQGDRVDAGDSASGGDDDLIRAGAGDDVIAAGAGADRVFGEAGSDRFIFASAAEARGDVIMGGEDAGGRDRDVLDLRGTGPLRVRFDGEARESGTVTFFADAARSQATGTLAFHEVEQVTPCFTPGTMIATPRGVRPVETLHAGDMVLTRDNGVQAIRWVGTRQLDHRALSEAPHLKPIEIRKGSLGHGLPDRDMMVSPQHRMLVATEATQLYFDEHEVLVPAKHLLGKWGVSVRETVRTTYVHFMCDRHEVVMANGAWTETFQPGQQTLTSMGEDVRREILALFPELGTVGGIDRYRSARRTLTGPEARVLQR